MEGRSSCPICKKPLSDSNLEDHVMQAHPTGFPDGGSAKGVQRRNGAERATSSETAFRKGKWLVFLALALVIIIVLATVSLMSIPKAVRNPMDFSLPDTSGNEWNLDEHLRAGKPILIEFIDLGCGHCIEWVDDPESSLKALHRNYSSEIEFVTIVTSMLGIITPTPELVHDFKEEYFTPWTYLIDDDGAVCKLYGIGGVPTVIIINTEGHIVWTQGGEVDYAILEAGVDLVL